MSLDGVLVLIGDMVVVRLMRTLSCNGPNDDSGSGYYFTQILVVFPQLSIQSTRSSNGNQVEMSFSFGIAGSVKIFKFKTRTWGWYAITSSPE